LEEELKGLHDKEHTDPVAPEFFFNVPLTKKEIELIFKWYDKGYTHADSDRPLFDKLKRISQGDITL
jgi:hypothetical protein